MPTHATRRPRRDGGGPRGVRRGRPPGGAVERPASATSTSSGPTTSTSTRRSRVARAAQGGRRAAVRLRLVVLDVRRLGDRRPARRERAAPPADGLRRVEGAGRGGARRRSATTTSRRLDAKRDGLRRLAAAAARHRPQQPRRLGAHDRAHPAPARTGGRGGRCPRPRPLARGARDARGARRARRGRGVQRRLRRAELPRPRPRGGARRRHGMRDRVRRATRRPTRGRTASTSRSSRARSRRSRSSGTRGAARRSWSSAYRAVPLTTELSRVVATSGCGSSVTCSTTASSRRGSAGATARAA